LSQLYLFNIIIILSCALTKYTNSNNSTEVYNFAESYKLLFS